ncbi:MAG: glycosyltransferase family 2 protein [Flavobacteriales bacterium]|nr:glycosyltransferase family 2 protein [Flavobacteriales bacterium]
MKTNIQPGLISVVIPVYNSQETIGSVCKIIQHQLNEKQWNFEIILVDDHSNSETQKITESLKLEFNDKMQLIRLAKNYGQNSATLCGISHAKGDIVVTLDDDLDYRPEDIIPLVETLYATEADVVYGFHNNTSILRKWGRKIIARFLYQGKGKYSTLGSSFRVLKKDLAEKVSLHAHDHAFINQIISWYTSDVAYYKLSNNTPKNSKSGYSTFELMKIGLKLIFFYSSFPLLAIMGFSFLAAAISFVAGIYYLIIKLSKGAPLGYTSTIVSILFGSSIILFSIGVLAAFINRIYDTRIKKPTFSIKHKT